MNIKTCTPPLFLSLLLVGCDDEVPQADPPAVIPIAELPEDATQNDLISYADYKQAYARERPDGSWLVEGDIPVADEAALKSYYDREIAGIVPASCADDEICPRSTVATSGGRDITYSVYRKLALTYCFTTVNYTDFPRVKAAITQAAGEWENATDVNFVHLSDYDGYQCVANSDVVFAIDYEPDLDALASAFFPDYLAPDRHLLFGNKALAKSDPELVGIMRHELGHALGLTHEHYRFHQDEEKCLKGSSASMRNVTTADAYSIMGYYFCNGIADPDNYNKPLSSGDRKGIHSLYSIPKGHGRLAGGPSSRANSFLGAGALDDIFWFTPGGTEYNLWEANASTSAITFTKHTETITSDVMEASWRPFAVQWHNTVDGGNFDREIMFYGPGSAAPDSVLFNLSNGSFLEMPTDVDGFYAPLMGKFHGHYTDIIWRNPLSNATTALWQTDGNTSITSTVATTTYNGQVHPLQQSVKALVGNFYLNASGFPEILWIDDDTLFISRGTGTVGFETKSVATGSHIGISDVVRHTPLLGNFNGDGFGDIFWYGPGDVEDRLWLLDGPLWDGIEDIEGTNRNIAFTIENTYKPLVGDFNGDTISDIFWYRPGPDADPLWLFNSQGGHTSVTRNISGDFSPIPGNFNNDQCSDILWFDAPDNKLLIWRSNCDGTFTAQATQDVPPRSYPVGYGIGY